ncbi:MAG: hypothetical protein H6832_18705 [Planctomycetes bacterium]|nr:hypothetical protein [Planctomycetota bacterium]MCB9920440.1 hypothetical protein [Planctomycetota bacterium]
MRVRDCFVCLVFGVLSGAIMPAAVRQATATDRDGAERVSVLGRVTDTTGKLVRGAKVDCWCRHSVGGRVVGPSDDVEATTDERGRFRVALVPNYRYAARATWTDGDGNLHATEIVPLAATRRITTLVEGRVSPPLTVEIVGDGKNFGRSGNLRFEVWSSGFLPRPLWSTDVDPSGRVEVPSIGYGSGNGLPVRVSDDHGELAASTLDVDGTDETRRVTIDSPRSVSLLVEDSEGKPLEGAEVFVAAFADDFRPRFYRLVGRTSADGTFDCPLPPTRRSLAGLAVLAVRHRGHQELLVQLVGKRANVDGLQREWSESGPLELRFRHEAPWSLTVIGGDGKPVPGLEIELKREAWLETKDESSRSSFFLPSEAFRTDAEGRVELPWLPANINDLEVVAIATADQVRALGPSGIDFSRANNRVTLVRKCDRRGGKVAALFDARALEVARLDVRDPSGSPVEGAQLAFADDQTTYPCSTVTNQRGSATVVLPDAARAVAVWSMDIGYAILDVGSLRSGSENGKSLTITLEPFEERVVHLTQSGKDVAGSSLTFSGWSKAGPSVDAREQLAIALFCQGCAAAVSNAAGTMTVKFVPANGLSVMVMAIGSGRGMIAADDNAFPLAANANVWEFSGR